MSNPKVTIERERKRQAAACDRSTGKFMCLGGNHEARGEPVMHRGRKYCRACRDKIKARAAR